MKNIPVNKVTFLKTELLLLFDKIHADTQAKWGKMNAQQMIEHLTGFFDVSTEKIKYDLVTSEDLLPKYKEFLLSDKEFRENTKAPLSVLAEEPSPTTYPTLAAAIIACKISVENFFNYFQKDPDKKTLHPVFGPLNFEEWVLLHYKHVHHHLKQFAYTA